MTVNMLLQRLRGADAITEAAVVTNLVPLALRAPHAVLQECITAFSSISRSSNPEDPRYSHNAVLAAQTSLARGFSKRNIAAGRLFLEEMLALFIDKGSQIQTHSVSRHTKEIEKDSSGRVSEMTSQLAALLLPIDAILNNPAYPTEEQPSPDLVSSFRNMWFLCTLLGLTSSSSPYMTEPARASLARIAVKTPALVLEEEKDYVSSVLEYNAVFRRDYAQAVSFCSVVLVGCAETNMYRPRLGRGRFSERRFPNSPAMSATSAFLKWSFCRLCTTSKRYAYKRIDHQSTCSTLSTLLSTTACWPSLWRSSQIRYAFPSALYERDANVLVCRS